MVYSIPFATDSSLLDVFLSILLYINTAVATMYGSVRVSLVTPSDSFILPVTRLLLAVSFINPLVVLVFS